MKMCPCNLLSENAEDYCLLSHRVNALPAATIFASSKSPKHSPCTYVSGTGRLENTMKMFPGSLLSQTLAISYNRYHIWNVLN